MNNRQITVPLVTRTGLHVGAGRGDAVTDALVRRDGAGRPVLPGTSLAGALREIATRLAPRLDLPSARPLCKALDGNDGKPCGCVVCQLFGDINPGQPSEDNVGQTVVATAARLWVYDAYPPGNTSGWIRDGVGIERAARVAHRKGRVKFDLETLPPGTKFELRLELEAGTPEQQAVEEKLIAAVLAEWAAGRTAIGGRTSRGLGSLKLQENLTPVYRGFDLQQQADLLAWLSEDDPWPRAQTNPGWLTARLGGARTQPANLQARQAGVAQSWVRLTVDLAAPGALLVNSPVTSVLSGFDHAPLLAAGDRDHPVLPGSGLKGALRSQAERIARTLATQAATDATDFLETCPVCSPVMSRPKPDQPQPQESCDSLLEALGVLKSTDDAGDRHLCLACQLFGSPRRGSRLRVEDASLVGTPKYKPRDFLAVDRFTGGGADQFKFDAAVLWTPRFKVVLYLENPLQWELGWLVLALRDFQEGLGTVGFGAAKGFGRVEAEAWRTEFGCLDDGDAHALGLAGKGTRDPRSLYHLQIVDQGEAQAWKQIADGWVSRFVAQVEAFRTTSRRDASDRPQSLPGLPTDTWFGTGAKQLYGNEEAVHA